MTETKSVEKPAKRPNGARGPGKFNQDMKEAIYRAFHELGGKEYLVSVGKEDPRTFLGLVAKVIPAELQVTGQVAIDLGLAMLQAEQRLNDMRTIDALDVTLEQPNTLITNDTSNTE
jgi:hypothetical protein